MLKKMLLGMLFSILVLGFAGISNATEYDFQIIDIKQHMPSGAAWFVGNINNNNIIAGYYYTTGPTAYYLWWYDLDTDIFDSVYSGNAPEYAQSNLNNLNVFLSYNRLFNIDTKTWSNAPITGATAHNDNGVYLTAGYVWDDGVITYIDFPGAYSTHCQDINNLNNISGWFNEDWNGYHYGFIWNSSTDEYTKIEVPGEHFHLSEINDNNIAVGSYPWEAGTLATADGYMERIYVPNSNYFMSAGINNNNVIVGEVNIGNGSEVAVGTPVHNVSISDDITITESDSAIFTVSLNSATYETLKVDFATADGSALADDDYEPQSGTLVFLPGDQHKTITIPLIDDTKYELTENFTVVLSNPVAPSPLDFTIIKDTGIATVTDNDNDDGGGGGCFISTPLLGIFPISQHRED